MTKLGSAITELREAVSRSWEPLALKVAKALKLALRGKAQVHPADDAGPGGQVDIWLEPLDVENLDAREVNRVLALTLGDKLRSHAQVTHDDEDGIIVTVGP